MGDDDDIAAALPRPPLPAPARREAAIAGALRRFDGTEPVPAAQDRGGARPAPWRWPRRQYAGALAGAFLVALIGLPFVWTSFDRSVPDGPGQRSPALEAGPGEAMADAEVSEADAAPPGAQADAQLPSAAHAVAGDALARLPGAGPSSVRKAGEPPAGRSEGPVADSAGGQTGEVVVTGSRIRRPDLESPSPITVLDEETVRGEEDGSAITVTGTRSRHAAARRRGDWNACTIDDPGRSLAACPKLSNRAAKGSSARADARIAEGVSRAWEGDLDAAIASFDRAIEAAPRSSAAYLNRGLAWRRRGDLDRALADLDRAVRFSPRAARYYYHRSLLLRQRGDKRRAEADEERAVALDPRYAAIVNRGR